MLPDDVAEVRYVVPGHLTGRILREFFIHSKLAVVAASEVGLWFLFLTRKLLSFRKYLFPFSIARQTREETDFREKKYRFEFNRG